MKKNIFDSKLLCRRAYIEEITLSCVILAIGIGRTTGSEIFLVGELSQRTNFIPLDPTSEELWKEYNDMQSYVMESGCITLTEHNFCTLLELCPFNAISWSDSTSFMLLSRKEATIETLYKTYC